jgi:hypothetical protein
MVATIAGRASGARAVGRADGADACSAGGVGLGGASVGGAGTISVGLGGANVLGVGDAAGPIAADGAHPTLNHSSNPTASLRNKINS